MSSNKKIFYIKLYMSQVHCSVDTAYYIQTTMKGADVMNINDLLKGLDSNKLQQLINSLNSNDKAEIMKKLGSLSERDIKNILDGR